MRMRDEDEDGGEDKELGIRTWGHDDDEDDNGDGVNGYGDDEDDEDKYAHEDANGG